MHVGFEGDLPASCIKMVGVDGMELDDSLDGVFSINSLICEIDFRLL